MKKGQALVEFIIILPVFIMLILMIIDFGRIMYLKITLEDVASNVVNLYNNGESVSDIKDKLDIDVLISNNKVIIKDYVEIMTPGLNLVFKNPYEVEVTRVINNE